MERKETWKCLQWNRSLLLFHSFLYCSNQICTFMVDQWQRLSKSVANALQNQPTDPTHAEVHWTEMRMSLELISSCASSRQVTWPGFKALSLHSYLMSSRTQGPQSGRLPTRNLRLTSLAPCTSGEVRWLDISLSIMIDVLVTWHKNCRSRPELDFACRLSAENWANKTLDSSYAQNTIQ